MPSEVTNDFDSTDLKTQNSTIAHQTYALADGSSVNIPPRKSSEMDHATPSAMVSAFCRAVLSNLIPREFWGTGEVQIHNQRILYRNVGRFVELRRFESLSLHEVLQGMKVSFK